MKLNDYLRKRTEKKVQTVIVEKQEAPKNNNSIRISREEFDLLNTSYSDTIYYITENDGSITVKEGEF